LVRNIIRLGEMRNAYKILIGKPEGKRPLGRQRRRWGYQNGESGDEVVECIYLARDMDQ